MTNELEAFSDRLGKISLYGLILLGLYLTSLQGYLLFHSLAEIFSVIIGCTVFIIAWNSRDRLGNNYLMVLGIAYLFVSILDVFHTLAYKGMGIFVGYDSNLPTQLWIAARYVQALALLMSPLFLERRVRVYLLIWGSIILTALLLAAIFAGIFPACFVEGLGLTPFKKISEYILILLFTASIAALLRMRGHFDREVLRWLIASIVLTVCSELIFTLYASVYDFFNLTGHFLKIAAFYFMYKAIVEVGLEMPHRLLFRELKQSELALQKALGEVKRLAVTDSLTALYNRRYFFELAELGFKQAKRYDRAFSVMMMDIDHFKQVNDTYGHAVGDKVLAAVAECCRITMRKVDIIGRYGGEEFVIAIPETDLDATLQAAERLRKSIASLVVDTEHGPAAVTVSLGIGSSDQRYSDFAALLDTADQALYLAKRSGRNRVCIL